MTPLKPGDHIQLHERIIDGRAGAQFDAVANFLAKAVESVGRAQATAETLGIVTTCDVAAIASGVHSDFKSHSGRNLRFDVDAVNDTDNEKA